MPDDPSLDFSQVLTLVVQPPAVLAICGTNFGSVRCHLAQGEPRAEATQGAAAEARKAASRRSGEKFGLVVSLSR